MLLIVKGYTRFFTIKKRGVDFTKNDLQNEPQFGTVCPLFNYLLQLHYDQTSLNLSGLDAVYNTVC